MAPRFIRPPKSIEQRGGIESYLNATVERHNGLGYRDWWQRVNPRRKHRVPRPVIADDFDVSKQTVHTWLKKDRKYQEVLTELLEEQLEQELAAKQMEAS